jgi:L-threonylcarbamoyladenylate synthase
MERGGSSKHLYHCYHSCQILLFLVVLVSPPSSCLLFGGTNDVLVTCMKIPLPFSILHQRRSSSSFSSSSPRSYGWSIVPPATSASSASSSPVRLFSSSTSPPHHLHHKNIHPPMTTPSMIQEEQVPPATTTNTNNHHDAPEQVVVMPPPPPPANVPRRVVMAQFTSDVTACLNRLRNGGLVAIPTETVYGLAANVQNETALLSIFTAKERPYSDPLIVHVDRYETAVRDFWQASPSETSILHQLAMTFWPGPLTMVCTAQSTVSSLVTAGTGMVAVRHPNLASIDPHLSLLLTIPFAAPSANKFGHVSPTSAQHVMDDLQYEDVWILTTKYTSSSSSTSPSTSTSDTASGDNGNGNCCAIGVESTVVQVAAETVTILRPGHVTYEQLVTTLPSSVTVRYKSNSSSSSSTKSPPTERQQHDHQVDADNNNDDSPPQQQQHQEQAQPAHVAPGQLLQHYSPHIPSYLIPIIHHHSDNDDDNKNDASGAGGVRCVPDRRVLRHAVVLDMYGQLRPFQKECLAYCNLGDTAPEIARQLFASLRWAETQEDAQFVFFPQLLLEPTDSSLSSAMDNNSNISKPNHHRGDSIFAAVADRLHRAASGRVLTDMADLLPLLLVVEDEEAVVPSPPPATASLSSNSSVEK